MAYIGLEPKSYNTIKYSQPFKLVLFHIIKIRMKCHKGSYYLHLLNNYLFNYLIFSGLTVPLGDVCKSCALRRLASGDTCPPPSGLEACAPDDSWAALDDNLEARLGFLHAWMCVVYKALMVSRRLACWCSLSCGSKRIPWVVAQDEIGVKHVTFLELCLRMTSLELWLELVSVIGVSVRIVACTDGSS